MKVWPIWIAIGVVTFLGMSALASADTVPVTWTGQPSLTSDCLGCAVSDPVNAVATQDATNQANADFQVGYFAGFNGFGPSSSFSAEDTFTLASAADISLAITARYSSSGSSCSDLGCSGNGTTWDYSGEFSGDAEIVSGNGTLDVPFGNSATVAGTCPLLGPGDCGAGIELADSESGMVDLTAGTYTLLVNYSDSNTSNGDGFSAVTLNLTLGDAVATPEPNHANYVVMLLLMSVVLKTHFKSLWLKSPNGWCGGFERAQYSHRAEGDEKPTPSRRLCPKHFRLPACPAGNRTLRAMHWSCWRYWVHRGGKWVFH